MCTGDAEDFPHDPWTPLLTATVGSHAYGLAGPESDIDSMSVAAAPTEQFHGLNAPLGRIATRANTNPDFVIHEVGKFVALCLTANPTVTELLWLPEDCYRTRQPLGDELIALRGKLLGAQRVRDAYLGYATSQFRRLQDRGSSFSSNTTRRTEKHARHLLRLIHGGAELYLTGRLTVRLQDPDRYREFGRTVATDPHRGLQLAASAMLSTRAAMDAKGSALPAEPDFAAANQYLLRVRAHFYDRQAA